MTNLSGGKKKKSIITPENSLIFIPVFIGLITLSSLLLLIFKPLVTRLSYEESKIEILLDKISYIPLYKKYINKISISTSKSKKQQQRIIKLISDPNELAEMLTEINNLSQIYGLEITKVELKPPIRFNNIKNNIDPFLISKLEKHNFKISFKGDYNNIINLLRELENLQAIAIIEEIEIDSIISKKDEFNQSINKTSKVSLNEKTNVPSLTNHKSNKLIRKEPLLLISFNLSTYANRNNNVGSDVR